MLVFPPLLFGGTLALGLLLHWIRPVHPLPTLVARLLGTLVLMASIVLARSAEGAMRPFNALWPLLLMIPMLVLLQWGVVAREERHLEAKFREPYRVYRSRVRPWI